jgi:hypothetical protein
MVDLIVRVPSVMYAFQKPSSKLSKILCRPDPVVTFMSNPIRLRKQREPDFIAPCGYTPQALPFLLKTCSIPAFDIEPMLTRRAPPTAPSSYKVAFKHHHANSE